MTHIFRTLSNITYLLAGPHKIRTYMSMGVRYFRVGIRHYKLRNKSLIKVLRAQIGTLSPVINPLHSLLNFYHEGRSPWWSGVHSPLYIWGGELEKIFFFGNGVWVSGIKMFWMTCFPLSEWLWSNLWSIVWKLLFVVFPILIDWGALRRVVWYAKYDNELACLFYC